MDDELIPIAALNQYDYCPHRCWRMFCLGEFAENVYTLEGTGLHERVHGGEISTLEGVEQYRTVELVSYCHGLIGKADLIERHAGVWVPVEYKRGTKGEWGNDRIQVCAQGLCLEEMLGVTVPNGAVYYAATGRRETFSLDLTLRTRTVEVIALVRELLRTGQEPLARVMPRCKGCSLYDACLPTAGERVRNYRERWE
ncbi:CRISPR-associated protein Cas4 [Anthocerotibacter panamensis]|uniref:CRISPR-associated protein Cas4 n=1 Tax=Anthocerotibacter panamensis TaxID=2857077 RepID=UPI001C402D13|nr:CRISPR-associated protein Cas4 [Anthocerotibacter panamensis]